MVGCNYLCMPKSNADLFMTSYLAKESWDLNVRDCALHVERGKICHSQLFCLFVSTDNHNCVFWYFIPAFYHNEICRKDSWFIFLFSLFLVNLRGMLSLLSHGWLRREKDFHGAGDLICTFSIHASHLEQIIDPEPKIQWLTLAIDPWQRSVTPEPPRVSPNVVAASWGKLTNVPYTPNLWMLRRHLYWMVTLCSALEARATTAGALK